MRSIRAWIAATGSEGWQLWTLYGLGFVLCAATAVLVWFGYRASAEWQRSSQLVAVRRADETLILLGAALNKDMKGAQVSVIAPINEENLALDSPYDFADRFERAFARFPYPESFFVWRDANAGPGATFFFHRADRLPAWDPDAKSASPYPVVIVRDPAQTMALVDRVREQAVYRRPFAVFAIELGGVPYQVVAHLLYRGTGSGQLLGFVAFTVNLAWVRAHYFGEIVDQIARIGSKEEAMALAILDEGGRAIATSGVSDASQPVHERRFSLLFVDPDLLTSLPNRRAFPQWVAQVRPGRGGTYDAAVVGARRTFWLMSVAAAVTIVGVLLTVRAVRASARLAAMKSDFVSTVTHELKTPLALFRLVADTLTLRRYTSSEAIHDYGRLLSAEVARFERLVDNLLTYSRISEVDRKYRFEAIPPIELVEDALDPFQTRLHDLAFDVSIDVAADLPLVRVDRPAMLQAFRNVIDNSIKYSNGTRVLNIRASAVDHGVRFEVEDRGIGIDPGELSAVFAKFVRGSNATAGGSGLGLAIARRIVEDHGGAMELRSRVGEGTTSAIALPGSGL